MLPLLLVSHMCWFRRDSREIEFPGCDYFCFDGELGFHVCLRNALFVSVHRCLPEDSAHCYQLWWFNSLKRFLMELML